MARIDNDSTDTIGNAPLVRLNRTAKKHGGRLRFCAVTSTFGINVSLTHCLPASSLVVYEKKQAWHSRHDDEAKAGWRRIHDPVISTDSPTHAD
jgi:hypothetical protein